jgi:hypothetical protein
LIRSLSKEAVGPTADPLAVIRWSLALSKPKAEGATWKTGNTDADQISITTTTTVSLRSTDNDNDLTQEE